MVLVGNRQFFCCGGKVLLRPEIKSSSRLSGGVCCCVSFWFWRLRPEKKSSSRLSGGVCCCVSSWFWRLRPEKKKIQSSVWRVVLLCQFLVLAGNWQFFCCGGKFLLRPEKQKIQSSVWRVHDHVCLSCRDRHICISST